MARILLSLPAEVLVLITRSLNGLDVGRLWLCGSTDLCRKMKRGGVQHFDVKLDWSCEQDASLSMPSLVREFGELQSFGVLVAESVVVEDIGPYLDALPPCLTSLCLGGEHLESALQEWLVSGYKERFSLLQTLRLPDSSRLSDWDLEALPSTLTELSVSLGPSLDFDWEQLPCVLLKTLHIRLAEEVDLNIAQLKHLSACTIEGGWSRLSLPPQLVHLHCVTRTCPASHLALFPRSLQTLDVIPWCFRYKEWLELLPPALITLRIRYDSSTTPSSFDTELLELLPRTLRTLQLPSTVHVQESAAASLPPSLTVLDTVFEHSLLPMNAQPADQNAPWFTSNAETHSSSGEWNGRPTLPTALTHLSTSVAASDAFLPVLPPGLLHFEWGLISLQKRRFDWPDRIRSFKADILDCNGDWTVPLRQPHLQDVQQMKRERDEHPEEVVRLPHRLTALDANLIGPLHLTSILGSALVHLNLSVDTEVLRGVGSEVFPPGWSILLPSTLISLDLHVPPFAADDLFFDRIDTPLLETLKISNKCANGSTVHERLENLPFPNLQTLDISFYSPFSWKHTDLSGMRKLRELCIRSKGIDVYPQQWAVRLPPRLLVLTITSPMQPPSSVTQHMQRAHIHLRIKSSKNNGRRVRFFDEVEISS